MKFTLKCINYLLTNARLPDKDENPGDIFNYSGSTRLGMNADRIYMSVKGRIFTFSSFAFSKRMKKRP